LADPCLNYLEEQPTEQTTEQSLMTPTSEELPSGVAPGVAETGIWSKRL